MLTIYLLVAAGIALMFVEPWQPDNTVSGFEISAGIAIGLAWPFILILAVLSWLFLAIAVRERINGQ